MKKTAEKQPSEIHQDRIQTGNPYLPLWERIPDGEPRVFTDPQSGKERMYVYGSHDTSGFFCGPDHVVWSAPLEDLTDWRHEGTAIRTADLEGMPYTDGNGNARTLHIQPRHVFYAPDVAYNPTTEKYTMIGFLAEGDPKSLMFSVVSDSPGGPFSAPRFVGWGFDPAILVDDILDENGHQRMYLYWSVEAERTGWAAELDPETVTILPGSVHPPRINGRIEGQRTMFSRTDAPFFFFEGPSIRKIGGIYVLSYARSAPSETDPNGQLAEIAYATSDNPFGDPAAGSGWEYGGVIIDNRGEVVRDPCRPGEFTHTFFGGNNHGGLIRAGNQWFQIYHRSTNKRIKRQSMAVRLNISSDEAGRLKIEQAEFTSEGFHTEGLDPYQPLYAACLCYALPNKGSSWRDVVGPVITTNDSCDFDPLSVRDSWYGVGNIRNHTWLGYKYFNFSEGPDESRNLKLQLTLKEFGPARIHIYTADAKAHDSDPEREKTRIGTILLTGEDPQAHTVEGIISTKEILKGRKALFLEFLTESEDAVAEINELVFIAG